MAALKTPANPIQNNTQKSAFLMVIAASQYFHKFQVVGCGKELKEWFIDIMPLF